MGLNKPKVALSLAFPFLLRKRPLFSQVVKILVVLLVLLSFGPCASSFATARDCYVDPCYQGPGLDMMWSVDGGTSFQVIFPSNQFVMYYSFVTTT